MKIWQNCAPDRLSSPLGTYEVTEVATVDPPLSLTLANVTKKSLRRKPWSQ